MRSKTPPREDVPQRKRTEKADPGPVPTIGELAAYIDWFWVICSTCRHQTAVKFAPLIERFGADASSDVIRQSARCTACGHKGATLQHPSWAGERGGWEPFPPTDTPTPK